MKVDPVSVSVPLSCRMPAPTAPPLVATTVLLTKLELVTEYRVEGRPRRSSAPPLVTFEPLVFVALFPLKVELAIARLSPGRCTGGVVHDP